MALSWVKKACELGRPQRPFPPISPMSPARFWGTAQVYWMALPSSNPCWAMPWSLGGGTRRLEGRAGREASVGRAGGQVPRGRIEQVLPVLARLAKVAASAWSPSGARKAARWRSRRAAYSRVSDPPSV